MNIKLRLIIMVFFQFFIWGSWLLTIGAYWFQTKQWSGTEFGAIFSTLGIASLFIYGMAFNFYNISGSLFIETQCEPGIRASSQGLFMMMTNGFGALMGSLLSGVIIDKFYTLEGGAMDWHGIWLTFAVYAATFAVLFMSLFRYRHNPKAMKPVIIIH